MWVIATVVVLLPSIAMAFTPPDEKTIRDAIGNLSGLPVVLQRAFAPDASSFDSIPKPEPNDWLAVHQEPGQTFDEFKASQPNQPTQSCRVIYLQPLGEFPSDRSPSIDKPKICRRILLDGSKGAFANQDRQRKTHDAPNPYTGNLQILIGDVLKFLKARVPADVFCILAITMEDLYPEPSWNFVFGQASLRDRVGVYTFARYDSAFYGDPRAAGYETLLLRRSCKVLAYETSHMFGLAHCTYFNCLMNGSNHLAESDRRPVHLCLVCLRKLQWNIGFDVVERDTALERVIRAARFIDEADWLTRHIKTVR